MKGVDAAPACDFEHQVAAQVGVGGRSGTKAIGLGGRKHVRRAPVCVGVDCDRIDPKFPACANDPQCDLTPVRN